MSKYGEQFKRFILFWSAKHEGEGGMGNARESFDTLEEAVSFIVERCAEDDTKEVFDCDTRRVVY